MLWTECDNSNTFSSVKNPATLGSDPSHTSFDFFGRVGADYNNMTSTDVYDNHLNPVPASRINANNDCHVERLILVPAVRCGVHKRKEAYHRICISVHLLVLIAALPRSAECVRRKC